MERKFYGILDFEARRKAKAEEAEPGMYALLEGRLRDVTFNKAINYMLDNATAEDKEIVDNIRSYLAQDNGNTTRLQIICYKANGLNDDGTLKMEKIFNGPNSISYLGDSVMPYIHPRGDDADCLEMVVNLQTTNGARKR